MALLAGQDQKSGKFSSLIKTVFQDNKDVLLLVTTKSLAAKVKYWVFWITLFYVQNFTIYVIERG